MRRSSRVTLHTNALATAITTTTVAPVEEVVGWEEHNPSRSSGSICVAFADMLKLLQ